MISFLFLFRCTLILLLISAVFSQDITLDAVRPSGGPIADNSTASSKTTEVGGVDFDTLVEGPKTYLLEGASTLSQFNITKYKLTAGITGTQMVGGAAFEVSEDKCVREPCTMFNSTHFRLRYSEFTGFLLTDIEKGDFLIVDAKSVGHSVPLAVLITNEEAFDAFVHNKTPTSGLSSSSLLPLPYPDAPPESLSIHEKIIFPESSKEAFVILANTSPRSSDLSQLFFEAKITFTALGCFSYTLGYTFPTLGFVVFMLLAVYPCSYCCAYDAHGLRREERRYRRAMSKRLQEKKAMRNTLRRIVRHHNRILTMLALSQRQPHESLEWNEGNESYAATYGIDTTSAGTSSTFSDSDSSSSSSPMNYTSMPNNPYSIRGVTSSMLRSEVDGDLDLHSKATDIDNINSTNDVDDINIASEHVSLSSVKLSSPISASASASASASNPPSTHALSPSPLSNSNPVADIGYRSPLGLSSKSSFLSSNTNTEPLLPGGVLNRQRHNSAARAFYLSRLRAEHLARCKAQQRQSGYGDENDQGRYKGEDSILATSDLEALSTCSPQHAFTLRDMRQADQQRDPSRGENRRDDGLTDDSLCIQNSEKTRLLGSSSLSSSSASSLPPSPSLFSSLGGSSNSNADIEAGLDIDLDLALRGIQLSFDPAAFSPGSTFIAQQSQQSQRSQPCRQPLHFRQFPPNHFPSYSTDTYIPDLERTSEQSNLPPFLPLPSNNTLRESLDYVRPATCMTCCSYRPYDYGRPPQSSYLIPRYCFGKVRFPYIAAFGGALNLCVRPDCDYSHFWRQRSILHWPWNPPTGEPLRQFPHRLLFSTLVLTFNLLVLTTWAQGVSSLNSAIRSSLADVLKTTPLLARVVLFLVGTQLLQLIFASASKPLFIATLYLAPQWRRNRHSRLFRTLGVFLQVLGGLGLLFLAVLVAKSVFELGQTYRCGTLRTQILYPYLFLQVLSIGLVFGIIPVPLMYQFLNAFGSMSDEEREMNALYKVFERQGLAFSDLDGFHGASSGVSQPNDFSGSSGSSGPSGSSSSSSTTDMRRNTFSEPDLDKSSLENSIDFDTAAALEEGLSPVSGSMSTRSSSMSKPRKYGSLESSFTEHSETSRSHISPAVIAHTTRTPPSLSSLPSLPSLSFLSSLSSQNFNQPASASMVMSGSRPLFIAPSSSFGTENSSSDQPMAKISQVNAVLDSMEHLQEAYLRNFLTESSNSSSRSSQSLTSISRGVLSPSLTSHPAAFPISPASSSSGSSHERIIGNDRDGFDTSSISSFSSISPETIPISRNDLISQLYALPILVQHIQRAADEERNNDEDVQQRRRSENDGDHDDGIDSNSNYSFEEREREQEQDVGEDEYQSEDDDISSTFRCST